MKLSELISNLTEAYELNGDMEVAIICNASIYDRIEGYVDADYLGNGIVWLEACK